MRDPDKHYDDGDDEEHVDETAQGVAAQEPQKPKEAEDNGDWIYHGIGMGNLTGRRSQANGVFSPCSSNGNPDLIKVRACEKLLHSLTRAQR